MNEVCDTTPEKNVAGTSGQGDSDYAFDEFPKYYFAFFVVHSFTR